MAHEHLVGRSRKTSAIAKIVDGVEQIAFSHAVVAQEAVDLGRHIKRGTLDVFEVGECEFVQNHQS